MICALGSYPRHQAGKATDANSDFRWRGGTQVIGRLIRPSRTAISFPAVTSTCQFIANGAAAASAASAASAAI
jgi:hypothetical protein